MNKTEFMRQRVCEMSIKELTNAIRIKIEQEREEPKFKVNDWVKVKEGLTIGEYGDILFIGLMEPYCGNVYQIKSKDKNYNDAYILDGVDCLNYCLFSGEMLEPAEEPKYPVVFEDKGRKFEVEKDGSIGISDKQTIKYVRISGTLDLLYKAVELSKKLRK